MKGRGHSGCPVLKGYDHLPREPSPQGFRFLRLGWHKCLPPFRPDSLLSVVSQSRGQWPTGQRQDLSLGTGIGLARKAPGFPHPEDAPTGISLCVLLHNLCNTVTPRVTSLHLPNTLQAHLISSCLMLNGAREVKEFPQAHPAATWCSKSCPLLSFAITCLLFWVADPFQIPQGGEEICLENKPNSQELW